MLSRSPNHAATPFGVENAFRLAYPVVALRLPPANCWEPSGFKSRNKNRPDEPQRSSYHFSGPHGVCLLLFLPSAIGRPDSLAGSTESALYRN